MNKKLLSLLFASLVMSSTVTLPVDTSTSWKSSAVRAARNFTLAGALVYFKTRGLEKPINFGEAGNIFVFSIAFLCFFEGTEQLIKACEQS